MTRPNMTRPKFFELTGLTGGAILGVAARSLRQAMKLFREDGHAGAFVVYEYGNDGKVKKLSIQL